MCKLPDSKFDLALPPIGHRFHLHGSPPCQKFSSVNKNKGDWRNKKSGIDLLKWYLNFALTSHATTWSMEEVASKETLAILEQFRKEHPSKLKYHVFDFKDLGVPQNRKRLLAGTPRLMNVLIRESKRRKPLPTIRSVISKPRGTHIRGSTTSLRQTQHVVTDAATGKKKFAYHKAEWTDFCFPIDGVAPTVLATHPHAWITGKGEKCNRCRLSTQDMAALQTFPPTYKFPECKTLACKLIGNAVPPRVAELMLRPLVEGQIQV